MMRKCHLNTCPVGVATQDPVLRARFTGQPEHVVNYFFFVAEELRELMAQLGIRKFDDLIGRADLLDMKKGIEHWKAKGLDFSAHLPPAGAAGCRRARRSWSEHAGPRPRAKALDNQLIELAKPALEKGEAGQDRTADPQRQPHRRRHAVGRSGQALRPRRPARRDTIHIKLTGTAGQSFGAFLARGVTLDLVGEANDYVGKGLSGGRIIVRPNRLPRRHAENIIVGNTVLYGAIEGEASSPASPASALRAQLGRGRGRRRRRRSRLRIHDRRHRRRARQDRAQLRGRHVGRRRLRARRGRQLRQRCNMAQVSLARRRSRKKSPPARARAGRARRSRQGRCPPPRRWATSAAQGPDRAPRRFTGSVQARGSSQQLGKAIARSSSRSCRTNIVAR
jgi:hypothetical protein